MKSFEFSPEEKIAYFDEISNQFYNCNFGRMSKADFELMMFNFYDRKLVSNNTSEDGRIDYPKCSEYRISKELGITQQKVKNLKIRNQLVNPIEYDWKKELAALTENARFDPDTRKVSINIPDPNLFNDIRNYLEEKGEYVDIQLNSRLLQLRAEYYLDMVVDLETDEKAKREIKSNIKEQFEQSGKANAVFDEKHIGKSLLEGAVDITTIAANIKSLISPTNILGGAVVGLLTRGKHLSGLD